MGSNTIATFDAVGNPKTVVDFDGSEIEYIYDPAYRLRFVLHKNDVSNTESSTSNIEYVYYPNGLVKNVIHGGSTWSYDYNANNQITSESLAIDSLTQPFELSYTYDNLMNVDKVTYPSDRVVDYNHNAFGETVRISGYLETANYHASGLLARAKLENGQEFTSTQDAKQRPSNWKLNRTANSEVFDFTYNYDVRDNITSITDYFNGDNESLTGLKYDGLSRLTDANGLWSALPDAVHTAKYAYNALGDITNKEIDSTSYGFTYPEILNGKLGAVTSSPVDLLGNRDFTYDDRGNVIANGRDDFKFNQMNQLIEVDAPEPGTSGFKYLYDGNAMRVKTITTDIDGDTGATYHIYNQAGQMMHELELGSDEQKDHIYFTGNRLATRAVHNYFDTDADGMPDYFEKLHGLDPDNPLDAHGDEDRDTLTNLFEYTHGMLPTNTDSDFDGLLDQFDPDTPLAPLVVLEFGLQASSVVVSQTDELSISFGIRGRPTLSTTVEALTMVILDSNGNDVHQVSTDIPDVLSLTPGEFKTFTISILIDQTDLSSGDYFAELRHQVSGTMTAVRTTTLDSSINPLAFSVEGNVEPPMASVDTNIEPIISFFLD